MRGEPIAVPANIGIDPTQPPELMAGLHTHDATGTIHNEAGTGSTLGQFFEVWGVEFTPTRLGPYEASGKERVRMWVDDEPSKTSLTSNWPTVNRSSSPSAAMPTPRRGSAHSRAHLSSPFSPAR